VAIEKLNTILLVDDEEVVNFLNRKVIEKNSLIKDVVVRQNGEEALDYLKERIRQNLNFPELILLDINMPKMDGFEFLEEYEKFEAEKKESTVIFILTTSKDPDDMEKAYSYNAVKGIDNKPLSKELLNYILDFYFDKKN
jgi:CheY-like chemotaxis protein